MTISDFGVWLGLANLLIAFFGICFVAFVYFEKRNIKKLKKDIIKIKNKIDATMYSYLNANSKVFASYGVQDVDVKIKLLKDAIYINPKVYNGYNSLGYAYLTKGDIAQAVDAFSQAYALFPFDPASLCDLAYAHLQNNSQDLCVKYLRKAIEIDEKQKEIILQNGQFESVYDLL